MSSDKKYKSEFLPKEPFDANTGRTWYNYEMVLRLHDIPQEEWKNKVILDVGASYKPSFDKKSDFYFPGAKVIALDPSFIIDGEGAYPIDKYDKYQKKNMSEDFDPDVERKIGVVQEMPIEDHSIDYIFSLMAVPLHLTSNHRGRMWAEMLRVLKPGGEIRIAPFANKGQNTFYIEIIKRFGFEVDAFRVEHGKQPLPKDVVKVKVPEDWDVDYLHETYEAFVGYLRQAELYAETNDWKSGYLYPSDDTDFEPSIRSPIPD